MARAMIMDPEQRDFLGKLTPGQSALFVTGQQKATFVQSESYYPASPEAAVDSAHPRQDLNQRPAEQYRGLGFRPFERGELRAAMAGTVDSYRTGPFDVACEPCRVRSSCPYREPMLKVLASGQITADFVERSTEYRRGDSARASDVRKGLVRITISASAVACAVTPDSVWCAFVHLWHRDPFNGSGIDFPPTHASLCSRTRMR